MRGGHGIKGTVGQPSVQQPTQGKLRTANLAKRGSAAGHRQGGPGFLARAADTDVSLRRTELPYPTQASDYLGLPAQVGQACIALQLKCDHPLADMPAMDWA